MSEQKLVRFVCPNRRVWKAKVASVPDHFSLAALTWEEPSLACQILLVESALFGPLRMSV